MKKGFFVSLGMLSFLVLFIAAGNFRQFKAPGDKPQTPYFIMQESGSVTGAAVKAFFAASDSTNWPVRDAINGSRTYAKGINVFHGATAGLIYLHLVDNPDGVYDKYYLSPDDKVGVAFDRILETGTTIDLDSLSILL